MMVGRLQQNGKIAVRPHLSIVNEARESGRTIILESTTGRKTWTGQPISAEDASGLLQAAESRPLDPNHEETGKRIAGHHQQHQSRSGQLVVGRPCARRHKLPCEYTRAMQSRTSQSIAVKIENLMAIEAIRNEPSSLFGTVIRAEGTAARDVSVIAKDNKGLVLGSRQHTL